MIRFLKFITRLLIKNYDLQGLCRLQAPNTLAETLDFEVSQSAKLRSRYSTSENPGRKRP